MENKMTIRFTLAEKWQDVWFRKLEPVRKLLFLYMCDNCNIAGIWEVDLEQATFSIGFDIVSIQGAYKLLTRGYETLDETHIWVKNFLKHQRNLPLNPNNAAHATIINLLLPYKDLSANILQLLSTDEIKGLTRGLQAPISISIGKSISKSKSKVKESKEKEREKDFEKFRKAYPGRKRGLDEEWSNFQKHKDWEEVLSLLSSALEQQIIQRAKDAAVGKFVPPWKNLTTWLNQRCWTEQAGVTETPESKEVKEQAELEREKEKIHRDYEKYYQEKSDKELRDCLKVEHINYTHGWLIKEILASRRQG